jgi:hypothetical protein
MREATDVVWRMAYFCLEKRGTEEGRGGEERKKKEEIKNGNKMTLKKEKGIGWALVAHACNPTYSGGRDQ